MDFQELETTAQLAQLELSEEEKQRLAQEITHILDYFNKMGQIDVDNLEPTTHVLMKKNRLRPDTTDIPGQGVQNSGVADDRLLENAPERDDRFITIPRIL
jgi:aspartyl-tRNA(Asn)/glutamyl-tRNA(Gln) amidotransferase subunit C